MWLGVGTEENRFFFFFALRASTHTLASLVGSPNSSKRRGVGGPGLRGPEGGGGGGGKIVG